LVPTVTLVPFGGEKLERTGAVLTRGWTVTVTGARRCDVPIVDLVVKES